MTHRLKFMLSGKFGCTVKIDFEFLLFGGWSIEKTSNESQSSTPPDDQDLNCRLVAIVKQRDKTMVGGHNCLIRFRQHNSAVRFSWRPWFGFK